MKINTITQYPRHLRRFEQLFKEPTITSTIASEINNYMYNFRQWAILCWMAPEIQFCIDMDYKMAKNSFQSNLIDYRLSDVELDNFEKWVAKNPPTFAAICAELATMGYKVSLTYVENSEAWCCSITGREEAKFNSKSTLTTWSDDVEEALLMSLFKVVVVFERGKWVGKAKSLRG